MKLLLGGFVFLSGVLGLLLALLIRVFGTFIAHVANPPFGQFSDRCCTTYITLVSVCQQSVDLKVFRLKVDRIRRGRSPCLSWWFTTIIGVREQGAINHAPTTPTNVVV